jgi:hypothetical protein
VIDVFNCEIKLILVVFAIAAVFSPPVSEHPQQSDAFLLKPGHHPIVQGIGGH